MGQWKGASATSWEEMIASIRPGSSGHEPAVHKPLLILMLLARAQRGESNEVYFNDIEHTLDEAIRRFGPAEKPGGPELPFWHLKRAEFWVVADADTLPRRKQGDRPPRTVLREYNAKGYVPRALWEQLTANPELINKLAQQLLCRFWPASRHCAIMRHVGLQGRGVPESAGAE